MGLENIKKVVGFGLAVGAALADAVEKPTFLSKAGALLHLVEALPGVAGVNLAAIKDELLGLNPAEIDELNAFIDANFSLADADKEKKIEAAIALVLDLAKVVESGLAMWKAASAPVAA